ncbi:MAG TPA: antitoxin [Pseudogracilibacillus sp.]|nr:antitoxin [Pseudogracilibacillus sp.]
MPDRLEDIMISLPKELLSEVNSMAECEQKEINEIIFQATESYVSYRKEKIKLHETMQKGYEEMAGINLNLCSEAFLAEEEAKTTSDRLVIGVY